MPDCAPTLRGVRTSCDTTPSPVVIAPEMATNVKAGVYAVSLNGAVHYTKSAPGSKTIETFYGFDL
jgi:hypothetical protein